MEEIAKFYRMRYKKWKGLAYMALSLVLFELIVIFILARYIAVTLPTV